MKIFRLCFQLESCRFLFNLNAFEKNDRKRVLKCIEKKSIALSLHRSSSTSKQRSIENHDRYNPKAKVHSEFIVKHDEI
jgi:hypothetical protein